MLALKGDCSYLLSQSARESVCLCACVSVCLCACVRAHLFMEVFDVCVASAAPGVSGKALG